MIRSQRKKGQKYPLLKQNQNRVHKAILTQTCVCSTTWIRQCVVSVFFQKCEGDLAAEKEREPWCTHNAHSLQNTYAGSFRSQVDECCQDRGCEEGEKAEPPGLQVLTEAGIVPSRGGSRGWGKPEGTCAYCKHIHAHTETLPSSTLITSTS